MEERMKAVIDEIESLVTDIQEKGLCNDQKVLDWMDKLNELSVTF